MILKHWTRLAQRGMELQAGQTVNAPWYVPALFAFGAFVVTWLRVELALALLILATALDRYRFVVAGVGMRVEHFVFLGVALAWLVKTRPQRKQFYFARADLLLVAYLAIALVSTWLFAPDARESMKFFALMVFGVVLFWFVRAVAANEQNFARGMWTLIAVGVAASAFGIFAWLVFPFGTNLGVQTYSLGTFETFSAYGTLYDSNTLGMYAMAAALLQVTLLLDAHFARWRVWLGAGILISLVAVALSLTRTAWLGLLMGLFLIFLFSPRRRQAIAIGGAALLLLVTALVVSSALAGGGGALADFSVTRLLTSKSIFFRLDASARAWTDFLAHPLLGNGANVFAQNHLSPSNTRDWISNFILMTLHDTGIIGLLLLGAWLLALGVETWRAVRLGQGEMRAYLLALTISYLALLVCYQATTVFWLGWNWVYVGMLSAAKLVITKQAARNEN